MKKIILSMGVLSLLFVSSTFAKNKVNQDPQAVCPLKVGETIPNVKLEDVRGKKHKLKNLISSQSTILIFYRGGWCPYCNEQLTGLATIEEQLQNYGYQIIAISPDNAAALEKTSKNIKKEYRLFSDANAEVIDAFGLSFQVDEKTRKKYKEYDIDLEKASGKTHFKLPVPAVYIVDQEGIVNFQYVNPNYKERIPAELVLEAARIFHEKASRELYEKVKAEEAAKKKT